MAQIYEPQYRRDKKGNYNHNKNIVTLYAGSGAYYLEDEHNEQQWIQNELRADMYREKYYSGVFSKQDNDLLTQDQLNFKPNLFSFKTMSALINGYMVNIEGSLGFLKDNSVINLPNINNVILPDAPTSGNRTDFVFLEMWFKEIKHTDDIWFNGNKNNYNGTILNDLLDERISGETCRRIQLQWAIRTAKYVNKSLFPCGFDETLEDGIVLAQGGYQNLTRYSFWRSDTNLDQKNNFNDKGLWVAGKGIKGEMGTIDGYVYAIPLFFINRRNTSGYSMNNPNGSAVFVANQANTLSRPDGKYANIIYKDDITDIRNMVNVDLNKIKSTNTQKLFNGQLTTSKRINKEYFGLNKIIPDVDTKLYLNFNMNTDNMTIAGEIKDGLQFNYVPGVECEAILFQNKGYLEYNINTNNKQGYVSLITKKFKSKDLCLFSVLNNLNVEVMNCFIKDEVLYVKSKTKVLLQENVAELIKPKEFTHIAISWSRELGHIYLIVNGMIFSTQDMNIDYELIEKFILGYSKSENLYCENVIFDEVEFSTKLTTSFNVIPEDVRLGYAKFCEDPQYHRNQYFNIPKPFTYTQYVTYTSDKDGNIEFDLTCPLGNTYTKIIPKLYHNSEATLQSVSWTGLGTNKIHASIHGLGSNVEYDLIVISEIISSKNQGFNYKPKNILSLKCEKYRKLFFSVESLLESQKHPLHQLTNDVINQLDCINTYNINNTLGCVNTIQYNIYCDGETITIPNIVYDQEITGVIEAVFNNENTLMTFRKVEDGYEIKLNKVVTGIVKFVLATSLPSVVYNYRYGGIQGLYQMEEVKFYGNGVTKNFTIKKDTIIFDSSAYKKENEKKHYAFVDGEIIEIEIEINDTFIVFDFNEPPSNKSDVQIFIVSEYPLLKSERIEVIYESLRYNLRSNINYISLFNNCDIIYHDNLIYTIFEEAQLSEVLKSVDVNLLPIENEDTLNTFIAFDDLKSCKMVVNLISDVVGGDCLPFLNNIKLENLIKGYNGFLGNVSIDQKTLNTNYDTNRNPLNIFVGNDKLNIFTCLVQDKNGQVKLCVFTHHSKSTKISNEQNKIAVDVFDLNNNVLLKRGMI